MVILLTTQKGFLAIVAIYIKDLLNIKVLYIFIIQNIMLQMCFFWDDKWLSG